MKVDTRAGSKELIEPLRALGVLVDPGILAAGDVEILGNGPEGRPILIGIEHKRIEDAIACMRDGRFADQMRAMRESFEVSWLLVEGEWERFDPKKDIAVRRGNKWFTIPGRVTYQEITAWLLTMAQAAGILLYRTRDKAESAAWLRALEMWWTAKEWEEHRAHLDWYQPPIVGNPFAPPNLAVQVAACLPHIGATRAQKVADHFKSVKNMCCNSQEEWVKIEGVGKKIASAVVAAIEKEG